MPDVSELKKVGEILKPLIADLAALAEMEARASDQAVTDATAAADALANLVANPTDGPVALVKQQGARADAIQAVRSALIELRIQAVTRNVSLTPSQELLRGAIVDSLKDKIGRVLVEKALTPLTTILSGEDIELLKVQLEGAGREIAQRQRAKLVLDTTVDVALVAGKIAMMLV
jgi:hypothetical protein